MTDTTLHVLHITPSLSRRAGGVSTYIWDVVRHSAACGLDPTLVALRDAYVDEDTKAYQQYRMFNVAPFGPVSLGYSLAVKKFLRRYDRPVDIVHLHGLRTLIGAEARRFAERRGVPLVISPHGQYEPWIVAGKRLRKRLIAWLCDNRTNAAAAAFHATSWQEVRSIRDAQVTQPVILAPIGLDPEPFGLPPPQADDRENDLLSRTWPELRGKKRLLFLSRLDKKKGLPNLAAAWGRLAAKYPDWRLVITGPDLAGFRTVVEQAFADAGVIDRTTFTGPQFGATRNAIYALCDLFVLPTFSENFGIVVTEALASRTPVITTHPTPWRELVECDCGWWIPVGIDPLTETLDAAMSLSDADRTAMGARGRTLVEQRYAWPIQVRKLREGYEYLMGKRDKPACVVEQGEQPGEGV